MKKDLVVKESKIAGRGVYTSRSYDLGELVLQPEGEIVHSRNVDWESLGDRGMYYLQVSPWKYLEPTDPKLANLNHSCNPNMGYKEIRGRPSFVAMKPIGAGEEVTFDYSTTMLEEWDEDKSTLEKCHCNSPNCRGSIGDFRNLPVKDQQRYIQAGVVPEYILRHMMRAQKKKN